MDIQEIGFVELPQANEYQIATRLFPQPTPFQDGNILIREMRINGELSPDIALIDASANTPIQNYQGEGEVTEIFYSTTNNKPVGVILMSPEGEISLKVYNPKTDGGPRGFKITKGWTMQTIIPEGTTLRLFEYWSPKGFAQQDGEKMYGENVLPTVEDERVIEKFSEAEKKLKEYMGNLSK